jgi:hypothetical protein
MYIEAEVHNFLMCPGTAQFWNNDTCNWPAQVQQQQQ